MASWGCPHEIDGKCQKVKQATCDPGMKGCALAGRFVFSNPAKNRPVRTNDTKPAGPESAAAGGVQGEEDRAAK